MKIIVRFSVGLLDALFGKKVEVEIPGLEGKPIKGAVTQKWLEKMQRESKAKPLGVSTLVHMLHPSTGYTVQEWIIEKEDIAAPLRDPINGDLYAMTFYKEGKPQTTFLIKEDCEKARHLHENM